MGVSCSVVSISISPLAVACVPRHLIFAWHSASRPAESCAAFTPILIVAEKQHTETMRCNVWFPFLFVALGAANAKQQQLEPLTKFRAFRIKHGNSVSIAAFMYSCFGKARRTGKQQMAFTFESSAVKPLIVIALLPGRLCAAAYVHNSQAFAVLMSHLLGV